MAKVQDNDLEVKEFDSNQAIRFSFEKNIRKGMKPLILPVIG